jgi:hypothetical protein
MGENMEDSMFESVGLETGEGEGGKGCRVMMRQQVMQEGEGTRVYYNWKQDTHVCCSWEFVLQDRNMGMV